MNAWKTLRTVFAFKGQALCSFSPSVSSLSCAPPILSLNRHEGRWRAFHTTVPAWEVKWIMDIEPIGSMVRYKESTQYKSGDKAKVPKWDLKRPRKEFIGCKELIDADENVHKLCSLDFGHISCTKEMLEYELVSRVRRYESDDSSIEVKIAQITAQIRATQDYLLSPAAQPKLKNPDPLRVIKPGTPRMRYFLQGAVYARTKLLRRLREWDYNKFCWVLQRLELEYSPPNLRNRNTPREIYRAITQKTAMEVRKAKLEKYHGELKNKQPEFLQRKAKELAAIDAEEKQLREELAALQLQVDTESQSKPSMLAVAQ
ncbi:28S ribosomal protein S15, mitochondrial-like [Paramacrobiotus metropolitanus]|uniref:28S ribosomal protein S15, mitochondrial-like n=1 Tax=Paramacrobiotus metropolitanus TaxID=2943436 RepID=UPI002445BFFD|nr:28S ribosomal protein S15, mitochondrial-like [Paramacrobiotus metropolitanus]